MAGDLPIALRRTRRSTGASKTIPALPSPVSTPKRKKRVRFSDPGPSLASHDASSPSPSTGLTPMIRRTTLHPTARRKSAPSRPISHPASDEVEEVTFLPLRQVLDGRVQRRLRRNGLSEEMNAIQAEKRQRARSAALELERLREELREKDAEIYQLQNATIIVDTERIWELERQVADLQRELDEKDSTPGTPRNRSGAGYDWTVMARDPFAEYSSVAGADDDDGSDAGEAFGETVFGDVSMADIQCSTPTRSRAKASASFPTPPLTSPTLPITPKFPAPTPPTPQSHVGVQVSFPSPERQILSDELASLHAEMNKLNDTLQGYSTLITTLNTKLAPHANTDIDPTPTPEAELEARLENLLLALSDRTAALLHLTSELSGLGFPGGDASEMITSLASGFRAARLELEYLDPGESALPLTSRGAEVLDLLLTRLRALARRAREDEDTIDEYHELEQSLRKQLSARVEVMDALKAELTKAQDIAKEKTSAAEDLESELEKVRKEARQSDGRVAELEVGVARLRGAVDGYIRDMTELEKLVESLDAEAKTREEAHADAARGNRQVLVSKENRIASLEDALSSANTQSDALRAQVADLEEKLSASVRQIQRLAAEVEALQSSQQLLSQQHGEALLQRDARVVSLQDEINALNEQLQAAHASVQELRGAKSALEGRMAAEKARAKGMVDSMKGELQRVVRMSQDFLETPKKKRSAPPADPDTEDGGDDGEGMPASPLARAGTFLAGDLARRQTGNKRRKYDSGLGFQEEDEGGI